jgi:hypothetical protein
MVQTGWFMMIEILHNIINELMLKFLISFTFDENKPQVMNTSKRHIGQQGVMVSDWPVYDDRNTAYITAQMN